MPVADPANPSEFPETNDWDRKRSIYPLCFILNFSGRDVKVENFVIF